MSSLAGLAALAEIGKTATIVTGPGSVPRPPVSRSRELERILAIPRRRIDSHAMTLFDSVTRMCERPEGTMKLWPDQRRALIEAKLARGLFAPLSVGQGKTLLSCLLPTMLDAPRAVILTSAGLVKQAEKLLKEYRKHFYIRDDIRWVSYGILSSANNCAILDQINPTLIVGDEIQALSAKDSARSRRFIRYLKEHPSTIFCGMSGTITKRSLRDYGHLLELALHDRSPLPREWKDLQEWSEAIDAVPDGIPIPRPPGALLELADATVVNVRTDLFDVDIRRPGPHGNPHRLTIDTSEERARVLALFAADYDQRMASDPTFRTMNLNLRGLRLGCVCAPKPCHGSVIADRINRIGTPLERARFGVRKRLQDTLGIVGSRSDPIPTRLVLRFVETPKSPAIDAALEDLDDLWERPDGEMLTYAMEVARVSRQLRLGGFYRWLWPNDTPDRTWLDARGAYRGEMRDFLSRRARKGLDSPLLVERAIARGDVEFNTYDSWVSEQNRLTTVLQAAGLPEGTKEPPVRWRWITDRIVQQGAAWARRLAPDPAHPDQSYGPGIIWTDVASFGRVLAHLAGAPWYGAGEEAAAAILQEDGRRSVVASIRAHGTGRNLQAFNRALVLAGVPTGAVWEQLCGRLHRSGQRSPVVTYEIPTCFRPEIELAKRDAKYIEETTGSSQKLLHCEWI